VELDNRNVGSKNWDWIKKGIPIRLEVGPKDKVRRWQSHLGKRSQAEPGNKYWREFALNLTAMGLIRNNINKCRLNISNL